MNRRRSWILAAVSITAILIAVQSAAPERPPGSGAQTAAAPPEQAALAEPPAVTIAPAAGARDVDPVGEVIVTADRGRLAEVRLSNDEGRLIPGNVRDDGTRWQPAVPLGYGRTYTVSVTARGSGAATLTRTSQFTTAVPDVVSDVDLTTTAGATLVPDATYGVGTVIVAQFDQPVTNRAAAEQRLKVTTTPALAGSWSWVNDRETRWRPRDYFPPETQVTVDAAIYGTALADGVYGKQDRRVSFKIGRSHVSVADDKTKQVSVYDNGALVRTMPTSMGRGGTQTVGGKTIHFWTQRGVYTVMDKANPVLMDSSTYGLPVESAQGYRVSVPYATRISGDGIYLHQKEDTVWAQGNTNVSAGCLNLSAENAKWFYEFSQPGDIVDIRNTGGEPLQQWQNGDWSVPWEQWRQGSALQGNAPGPG